ncbi:MAG TPA: NAD(P)H-dependent oxidoreductase [Methanolinea sp.]|nr:NAD(P)H-dependent oxidoreductase [Methanolinea sp.]HQK55105.1 NAD(P)H-dependent oxidoreductase [Methanolinea sp.]
MQEAPQRRGEEQDHTGEITWRCNVCGFIFKGEHPPKGCPRCGSPSPEFIPDEKRGWLTYDGSLFDVLLINGSTHRAHNTSYMVDLAERELESRGVSYRRFNLSEYSIDHCWCCYSIKAEYCTYPCRNSQDDMPAFHQMLASAKAVIVASPINWNNMSARLKDFLDRTTCMQNLFHLDKPGLTDGKVVGILISGHEDGAVKTALDIYLIFEQMGYILAPFGIAFRTHGSAYKSSTDAEFFRNDRKIRDDVRGVVSNVVELMQLDLESRLKGRLMPVSE